MALHRRANELRIEIAGRIVRALHFLLFNQQIDGRTERNRGVRPNARIVDPKVETSEDRRLHSLARIFWGISHTLARAHGSALHSLKELGRVWAYTMRTFVLDATYRSEKLRRRAEWIVMELAGVPRDEAVRLLQETDGDAHEAVNRALRQG